jgi:hypothetical protein
VYREEQRSRRISCSSGSMRRSSTSSNSSMCTDCYLDSQRPFPSEPADLHLPLPQGDGGQYDQCRGSDGCLRG